VVWVHNEGSNGVGSTLTVWHKEAFTCDSFMKEKGFIIIIYGQRLKSNLKCVVVNVYATCNLIDKEVLWEDLSNIKSNNHDLAWCFCGDFNAVRKVTERLGSSERESQTREIRGFNNFIERNFLVELPLVGKKFTWFKANGSAKSRLDRVFVSDGWLRTWPESKQYVQPREVSDHCAIVVKSLYKDWGPRPFKSIDAWQLEPWFWEMVKGKWESYYASGNPLSRFKDKLKFLKAYLRIWNREVFGCMDSKKNRIMKEIKDLDIQDDDFGLEGSAREKRAELLSQLCMINKNIESISSQKARCRWYKHGDSNSKFFHSIIRWRSMRNVIMVVDVENQWCEDPEVVHREAKNLFEERFTATHDFGVRLGSVEFKVLPLEISLSMIVAFSEEELREAVWMCEGSKSPGPDGFNFNFIKKYWDVLKQDILAAALCFQESGQFPKGCNASFITLVPKVRDPVTLDQYRPISLVGALYKVIFKALSLRIKKVLPMVIDEFQSAYLEGRGMLDSVLVANENVEELRRKGMSGLCLKVDYEKAYDSVRWNFLYDMMRRMGFHSKWIAWIRGCLESTTISVLVNGSPTSEFKPTRGLRQGDPLAPFLFLVVVEGLAGLVRQATKANLLKGVKVGFDEVDTCILQFADDTFFVCQDS